jgi:hypothetical protein
LLQPSSAKEIIILLGDNVKEKKQALCRYYTNADRAIKENSGFPDGKSVLCMFSVR